MEEIKGLREKYIDIRKYSEKLCENLKTEDYVPQPIEDVSPPKWHLGHTTWFFEVFILMKYKKGFSVFNRNFHYLFNSYYETFGERVIRANRGNLSRPTVEQVFQYRKYIDSEILDYLDSLNHLDTEIALLFNIGLNHEQQHQELFIYDIKYILGTNPLFPAYVNKEKHRAKESGIGEFMNVQGGLFEIGNIGENFCFDNEMPRHQTYIDDFRIMDRLVTNGEYYEFIESGGYSDFNYWLSDGCSWKDTNNITCPLYWYKIDGQWYEYNLDGLDTLDMNKPVSHVSYYEAEAYAAWRNKRLPSEMEWEIAAGQLEGILNEKHNLLNRNLLSTDSPESGSFQFWGDAWEWTASSYLPYPGYKKGGGALGEYNGKFMIDQMVLKGGSYATPFDHIRLTYRNFFQTNKRWPITGIRLAENI